jgi:predicted kinase
LVRAGTATVDDVREIARVVAAFHAGAVRNDEIDASGAPDVVREKLERDLLDLAAFAGRYLDAACLEEAGRRARGYLAGRRALLEQRVRSGWICDGHGDLLADDVFCLPDGPRILDCIEFDDRLRYGDVLSDVAFLAMDLTRLGAGELADQFLRSYAEFSGEHHPASLVDYYIAFRALIRAKVACVRADQGDGGAADDARALLELACDRLCRARVALVLIGGPPGTGKSTLAGAIGDELAWATLRSDVVRKELAGLAPADRAAAGVRQGLYADAMSDATYDELLRRARGLLAMGESVVLDASWTRAAHRAAAVAVARETESDLVELRCDASPTVAELRIAARLERGVDASDATIDVARALRSDFEPWPSAVAISTDASEADTLARALAVIGA